MDEKPEKKLPEYAWADLKKIEDYGAKGVTKRALAGLLGISPQTFYNAVNKGRVDILDAYKKGLSRNELKLVDILMEMAEARNLGAVIFALKSRHNWSELGDSDVPDESDGKELETELRRLSKEEREAEIEALLKKRDAKDAK